MSQLSRPPAGLAISSAAPRSVVDVVRLNHDLDPLLAIAAPVCAAAVLLRELVDVLQGFVGADDLDDTAADLEVAPGLAMVDDTERNASVAPEVALLLVPFHGVDQDIRSVVIRPRLA